MKTSYSKTVRAAVLAVGLTGMFSAGTASAQIVIFPPPAFVATAAPVYYEGHPAYWYNNHWYYRDARGGWGYYHDEPAFLHDHRGGGYGRYHYEGHERGWHR